MKKLNLLLLFIGALVLTSCDPSQNIAFINSGKSNLKVKLIINPEIKNEAFDKLKKGDSVVFNLKPGNKDENEVFIYFGRGRWDEEQIKETAKSIKSIEIENADNKATYKSDDAIYKLLTNNKKGLIFKTIEINVGESFFVNN